MLSWIPLIGPIIQGISSIFTSYQNTKVAEIKANVQAAQISEQIIKDTNDDICLRILRDAALLFPVTWSALIGWDTIVSYRWHWLMFHVGNYPQSVGYIPYAAMIFLFGNIGLNIWKNK